MGRLSEKYGEAGASQSPPVVEPPARASRLRKKFGTANAVKDEVGFFENMGRRAASGVSHLTKSAGALATVPAIAADKVVGLATGDPYYTEMQDAVFPWTVDPSQRNIDAMRIDPKTEEETTAGKFGGVLGDLIGMAPEMVAAGPINRFALTSRELTPEIVEWGARNLPAWKQALPTVRKELGAGMTASAPMTIKQAQMTYEDLVAQGLDDDLAAWAAFGGQAPADYVAMGVPLAIPGKMTKRALSGGGAGVAGGVAADESANITLEGMGANEYVRDPLDMQARMPEAGLGAAMAILFGQRPGIRPAQGLDDRVEPTLLPEDDIDTQTGMLMENFRDELGHMGIEIGSPEAWDYVSMRVRMEEAKRINEERRAADRQERIDLGEEVPPMPPEQNPNQGVPETLLVDSQGRVGTEGVDGTKAGMMQAGGVEARTQKQAGEAFTQAEAQRANKQEGQDRGAVIVDDATGLPVTRPADLRDARSSGSSSIEGTEATAPQSFMFLDVQRDGRGNVLSTGPEVTQVDPAGYKDFGKGEEPAVEIFYVDPETGGDVTAIVPARRVEELSRPANPRFAQDIDATSYAPPRGVGRGPDQPAPRSAGQRITTEPTPDFTVPPRADAAPDGPREGEDVSDLAFDRLEGPRVAGTSVVPSGSPRVTPAVRQRPEDSRGLNDPRTPLDRRLPDPESEAPDGAIRGDRRETYQERSEAMQARRDEEEARRYSEETLGNQNARTQERVDRVRRARQMDEEEEALFSDPEGSAETTVEGPDEPPSKPPKPAYGNLLGAIRALGGLDPRYAEDLAGERGYQANQRVPGLFRKGGRGLDEMAVALNEAGWMGKDLEAMYWDDASDGGVRDLTDMIQAVMRGEEVLHPEDQLVRNEWEMARRDYDAHLEAEGLEADAQNARDAEIEERARKELSDDAREDIAMRAGEDDAAYFDMLEEALNAKADEGQKADSGDTPSGRAEDEGGEAILRSYDEADLKAKDASVKAGEAKEKAEQKRLREKEQQEQDAKSFELTGSDRPRDANPKQREIEDVDGGDGRVEPAFKGDDPYEGDFDLSSELPGGRDQWKDVGESSAMDETRVLENPSGRRAFYDEDIGAWVVEKDPLTIPRADEHTTQSEWAEEFDFVNPGYAEELKSKDPELYKSLFGERDEARKKKEDDAKQNGASDTRVRNKSLFAEGAAKQKSVDDAEEFKRGRNDPRRNNVHRLPHPKKGWKGVDDASIEVVEMDDGTFAYTTSYNLMGSSGYAGRGTGRYKTKDDARLAALEDLRSRLPKSEDRLSSADKRTLDRIKKWLDASEVVGGKKKVAPENKRRLGQAKKAKDFEDSGNWVVEVAGKQYKIYRDPPPGTGWWFESGDPDRKTRRPGQPQSPLGFTKAEAIEALNEKYGKKKADNNDDLGSGGTLRSGLSPNDFAKLIRLVVGEGWTEKLREFKQDIADVRESRTGSGNPVKNGAKWLFETSIGHIRSKIAPHESKWANRVLDQFYADAGGKRAVRETFDEAVTGWTNKRLNKVGRSLADLSKEQVKAVVAKVRSPRSIQRGRSAVDNAAADIRAELDEALKYMRAAGVDVGEVRDGYFPREFDLGKVSKGGPEFKKAAERAYREEGLSAKDAKAAAEELWETLVFGGDDSLFKPDRGSVASPFLKGRVFGKRVDDANHPLNRFLVNDPTIALPQYFQRVARRAEIARRFGDRFEWWHGMDEAAAERAGMSKVDYNRLPDWKKRGMKREMIDEGLPEDVIGDVEDFISMAAGVRNTGTNKRIARFSSMARTYTTMMYLEKATLSSLAEFVTPAIRSGNWGMIATSLKNTIADLAKTGDSQRLREFGEDLGLLSGHFMDAFNSARFAGGDVIGLKQTKILDRYFRRVGLTQWTEATRVASIGAGQVFLRRLAKDNLAGKDKNLTTRYLAELGIEAADQKAFAEFVMSANDGHLRVNDVKGDMGDKYRTAITRFMNQSIMAPNAIQKPKWANSPLGSIIAQLQSFNYAFYENVWKRAARTTKGAITGKAGDDVYTAAERWRLAQPMLMMPVLMATAGLVGEARDALFGFYDEDQDPVDRLIKAFSRGTPLAPADPWINWLTGARYKRKFTDSVIGPGIGAFARGADATGEWLTNNSPKTNKSERKAMKEFYNLVVEPSVNILMTWVPNPAAAAATQFAGSQNVKEMFVDATIGKEEKKGSKKPYYAR